MGWHLVGHDRLVLTICVDAVGHLLHARDDFVAHVHAELAHLPRLDEGTVLALSLAGCGTDTVALGDILDGGVVSLCKVGDGLGHARRWRRGLDGRRWGACGLLDLRKS